MRHTRSRRYSFVGRRSMIRRNSPARPGLGDRNARDTNCEHVACSNAPVLKQRCSSFIRNARASGASSAQLTPRWKGWGGPRSFHTREKPSLNQFCTCAGAPASTQAGKRLDTRWCRNWVLSRGMTIPRTGAGPCAKCRSHARCPLGGSGLRGGRPATLGVTTGIIIHPNGRSAPVRRGC